MQPLLRLERERMQCTAVQSAAFAAAVADGDDEGTKHKNPSSSLTTAVFIATSIHCGVCVSASSIHLKTKEH